MSGLCLLAAGAITRCEAALSGELVDVLAVVACRRHEVPGSQPRGLADQPGSLERLVERSLTSLTFPPLPRPERDPRSRRRASASRLIGSVNRARAVAGRPRAWPIAPPRHHSRSLARAASKQQRAPPELDTHARRRSLPNADSRRAGAEPGHREPPRIPVRSTNRIACSASRSGTRRLDNPRTQAAHGSNGSIRSHTASGIRQRRRSPRHPSSPPSTDAQRRPSPSREGP